MGKRVGQNSGKVEQNRGRSAGVKNNKSFLSTNNTKDFQKSGEQQQYERQ